MQLKDLRILIEMDAIDKGGLEKVVLDSARMFRAYGSTVTIVSVNKPGFMAEKARQEGFEVFGLNHPRPGEVFKRILSEKHINLSCSHFSYFGYPYYNRFRIPNVTFIHNVYAFLRGEAWMKFVRSDPYVDRYIAVSRKAAQYAVEKLGVDKNKVVTACNGLDVEEHLERERKSQPVSRADMGIATSDYVFLNVASYNLHKGHYLMADAMRRVLRQRQDVKIVCIGHEVFPPHVAKFRDDLKKNGLERHILLPGFTERSEEYLQMADAFLLPSLIEGWSIAMNEAMFYGKPMILTDTGGASEVIENSDLGIIIPTEYGSMRNLDSPYLDYLGYERRDWATGPDLAAAMLEFAAHREKWREAGLKGRDKIISRLQWKQVAETYEQVFLDTAQTKKKVVRKSGREYFRELFGRLKRRLKRYRLLDILWTRLRPALFFYLANSFFMKFPSYSLRHAFLRRFCHVRLGRNSSVLSDAYITGPYVEIGDFTVINRYVYLDGRVSLRIGNNVHIAHYTKIHTLTHDPQNPDFVCVEKPVVIEDHAWIGSGAIILPGVRIGEGAVIGAGAVVTKDIPAYTIAVGNPAKVVKERTRDIRYRFRYRPLFNTDIQLRG